MRTMSPFLACAFIVTGAPCQERLCFFLVVLFFYLFFFFFKFWLHLQQSSLPVHKCYVSHRPVAVESASNPSANEVESQGPGHFLR